MSKAYRVIERFSEDVDIVLDRHALRFTGEQDPLNGARCRHGFRGNHSGLSLLDRHEYGQLAMRDFGYIGA